LSSTPQIDSARLHAALETGRQRPATAMSADQQPFTNDEAARISMLAGHLTDGMSLPV
jgi:hypothetical protein